jgi:hypothetical protein
MIKTVMMTIQSAYERQVMPSDGAEFGVVTPAFLLREEALLGLLRPEQT